LGIEIITESEKFMNSQNLFLSDGKPSHVWFCEKCRVVHADEVEAAACCQPAICEVCHQPMNKPKSWRKCDKCRDREFEVGQIQKEAEWFAAAEKVAEFDGWVYCDQFSGHNEGFFESLDHLAQYCYDESVEMPDYCWACAAIQFVVIDISDALQNIEENGYEDFDSDDCKGLEELKAAVTAFNEANVGIVKYQPDYERAVILPPEVVAIHAKLLEVDRATENK
jgi:hypothetical protein